MNINVDLKRNRIKALNDKIDDCEVYLDLRDNEFEDEQMNYEEYVEKLEEYQNLNVILLSRFEKKQIGNNELEI